MTLRKNLVGIFLSSFFVLQSSSAFSIDYPSYDEQAVDIFDRVAKAVKGEDRTIKVIEKESFSKSELQAINKINDLLKSNSMRLKNIVFREDQRSIRVTFSNKENSYLFKIGYRTASDPVLQNSLYANKNEIIDIKIMFKHSETDKEYSYLNILGNNLVQDDTVTIKQTGLSDKPDFVLVNKLGDEKCRFCHIVAENDGSKGLFFTRYHESKAPGRLELQSYVFREDRFVKKSKSDFTEGYFPKEMSNDFYYSSIVNTDPVVFNYYSRTLFEMPELLEVLARDNKKNYCINASFPSDNKNMDKYNYVCADYDKKRLFVKYKNKYIKGDNGGWTEKNIPFW